MSDGRRVDWGSRSRWEVHRGVYFGANGGLIRGLIFGAHVALGLLHRALAAVANVVAGGAGEFSGFVEGAAGLVDDVLAALAGAVGVEGVEEVVGGDAQGEGAEAGDGHRRGAGDVAAFAFT